MLIVDEFVPVPVIVHSPVFVNFALLLLALPFTIAMIDEVNVPLVPVTVKSPLLVILTPLNVVVFPFKSNVNVFPEATVAAASSVIPFNTWIVLPVAELLIASDNVA